LFKLPLLSADQCGKSFDQKGKYEKNNKQLIGASAAIPLATIENTKVVRVFTVEAPLCMATRTS
jgi:hypothetical protein